MTKTYTQAEAVRDILRITLDSSIRPLSQTHGDQVREILDQLIATTRRETVEEIAEKYHLFFIPNWGDAGRTYLGDELDKYLDQLPDKQEA